MLAIWQSIERRRPQRPSAGAGAGVTARIVKCSTWNVGENQNVARENEMPWAAHGRSSSLGPFPEKTRVSARLLGRVRLGKARHPKTPYTDRVPPSPAQG